ncbi:type VI secretion-associated protein, VC_A0119 family [Enterovibrio nigricans DSM 22720]|uniref:Type VI secretion-associated protein, VC_A0119 family n=1 Tax=Enterovibrio nigricans DSM 22720 TaxID=1121868 RepID=A0A1T4VA40_9GAMM|nr:type VI secretion-associated protein, VC_A0119 family [Enterovibrio nigricans DSM 22720]
MADFNVDPFLSPISDASPTGEDARYELAYELMEAEVKKFGSLFGETVDWNVVEKNAAEVLCHYSKDLKAACYLVRAMLETKQLHGLEQGFAILLALVERFGGGLHPTRKRGRDGAIEWLNHQMKLALPKEESSSPSWSVLSECLELVEKT